MSIKDAYHRFLWVFFTNGIVVDPQYLREKSTFVLAKSFNSFTPKISNQNQKFAPLMGKSQKT
jgi:hypothetical protein